MHWQALSINQTTWLPKGSWAHRLETSAGALVLVEAAKGNTNPIAVIFAGFTGDAWTHQHFIKSALENNVSCLCVTPTWATTTSSIRKNIEGLLERIKADSSIWNRISFIRGTSYGSYLSLFLLERLKSQINKVAWIAPCSNSQILDAGVDLFIPQSKSYFLESFL